MLRYIWNMLLIITFTLGTAEALKPGDKVADFSLPSLNGAPQRLSEQIGRPVMLIWLNECDACEEALEDWQYLAESWASEGLEAWVVFRKQETPINLDSRLPLLEYQLSNDQAWWFEPSPAVMFISPAGVLDYLYSDRIDERKVEIAIELKQWLENKNWFQ